MNKKISEKIKKYHFEFRHLTVLLFILITFQIILSFIQKSSLQNFLHKTQEWYQRDSAERMANLNTTSLELLLENVRHGAESSQEDVNKIIKSFNIIFSQQLLEPNVLLTCLIILKDEKLIVIDDGRVFFNYIQHEKVDTSSYDRKYQAAMDLYLKNQFNLSQNEEIISHLDDNQTFHILVPFVPHGEFIGAFYMKNKPNFNIITQELLSSYDEVAIIYSSLILFGLLAMYYISSFTVKERDEARQLLYDEHEEHLKDVIIHEKESMFTKRIYHTHHKAEKVMGFIKEDLRQLSNNNIDETKAKLNKYANFVSRVIYDMKWYDPPIQTIRNPIFNTNINEVIKFIVDNLFLRISKKTDTFDFILNLDKNLLPVQINEFVVWEIIEPLIQNSLDHANVNNIIITISTKYLEHTKKTFIEIADNGNGIRKNLLELNEDGIKKLFVENITTKDNDNNRGYGCYIAYQMAVKRCGWKLDAENLIGGGCKFIIEIDNKGKTNG